MAKPVVTLRTVKGAALSYNELDTNFTNLRDSTINFTGDAGDTRSMDLNDATAITGERNIKVTVDEATQSIKIRNTLSDYSTDPNGFENRTDSTISFNSGTRVFTIAPASTDYEMWNQGQQYTISTSKTVTITNTTGIYLVYFDGSTLSFTSGAEPTWSIQTPVSYVYWNATTSEYLFTDERHGIRMDASTKEYLHETAAMAYAEGFAASNYTVLGDGSSNTHAQLDIADGVCYDQDIRVAITHSNTPTANTWEQDLQGPARIPVVYHSGATGAWRVDAVRDYPVKNGTSLVTYNLNTAGTWSTPDCTSTYYVAYWIVATNFLNTPIIAVMGQRQDNKLSDAVLNNTWTSLDLTSFPAEEFRPLYRVIVRTASGYANTPKAYFAEVADARLDYISVAGSTAATNAFENIVVGATTVSADSATDTLTLSGATGVSLSADSATDTITIAGTPYYGEIQSGTAGRLGYYVSGISGPAAGKTLDDALIAYANTGTEQSLTASNALALNASGAITLTPSINTNISLNATGTGGVQVGGYLTVNASGGGLGGINASSIGNGGSGVIIDGGGTVGITNSTNADIYITPVGTGKLNVMNDMNIGTTSAGATIQSNWNNSNTFILLKNRNASGVGQIEIKNNNVEITAGTGSNTGDIILKTGGSGRNVAVGDGSNQAVITSAIPGVGTSNLRLNAGTGGAIVLGSANDSNITITPNGTGQTAIKNLEYNEFVYSLGTTSGTITPDATNGNVQTITLNGNLTINAFNNPVSGQTITLVINTNGTGRTLTSSMLFAGASKTLSTTNTVDILTMSYIGTTYYASLVKGYA